MADKLIEEILVQKMIERNYRITTVESCTGGLLAGRILNVSGASRCYNQGYITYSNEAKETLVGVSHETLERVGAVSEEVAGEMAKGGAKVSKSNIALSVTGIAGPEGGTKEKPVGLVYIGCYLNGTVRVRKCNFSGDRLENRNHSVEASLQLLKEMLNDEKNS